MASLAVILVGAVLTVFASRGLERREMVPAFGGYFVHVVGSFAAVFIFQDYYSGGDITAYYWSGGLVTRLLEADFERWFPEILKVLFQIENRTPLHGLQNAGSTGTMAALAGLARYLVGDSIRAMALLFSVWASIGALALYRVFRNSLGRDYRLDAQVACLFVPSVVFWTSGIFKESVGLGGVGFFMYGFQALMGRRLGRALPLMLLGGVAVALAKPYILVAIAASVGAWFYWERGMARSGGAALNIRPIQLAAAALLTLVMMIGIGEIFPRFSVDNLASEAAVVRETTQRVAGDSTYDLGDTSDRSMAGQLIYVPVALLTALYRPLIFEARNAVQLISALEMTLFLILTIRVFWRRGPRGVWNLLMGRPSLVMSLVFAIVLGIGVGLATSNLGALSRYRVPLMPFYLVLLLALNRRTGAGAGRRG